MKTSHFQAAVIGGGASGYTAAAALARKIGGKNVVILEKQAKPGRKLLTTGNGRCNISNEHISPERYHGDKAIVGSVLSHFSVQKMYDFFGSLGVMLRADSEGRIYPYSNQAATILTALQDECFRMGVTTLLSFQINSVKKDSSCFVITSDDTMIRCEKLIFACGSKASPKLGADDSGFRLLSSLGIEHTPLFPALSPVLCGEKRKSLKGVRAKGKASLISDKKAIKTTYGEIQFTESGLSGICIFELSRSVNEFFLLGTINGMHCSLLAIALDLIPDLSFSELCQLFERNKNIFRKEPSEKLLCGILNRQLADVIANECHLSGKPCSSLTSRDIKNLTGSTKQFLFTPSAVSSFESAQVCAGGVSSKYVDPKTLMSRKHNNLYICGEMLNVDGDCGGFNLHFAVGSAILAAENI